MDNWRDTVIAPTDSVRRSIEVIDSAAVQLAIVVDAQGRLAGIVGDGDIRRALLKGIDLDGPVTAIMNSDPISVSDSTPDEELMDLMVERVIRQVPVVDAERRLVGLRLLNDYLEAPRRSNRVVIMAGGLGSRLRPYTDDCPKPMLRVGGRPMLETIMRGFARCGFHRFTVCVNYKPHVIREYFGDGSKFGFEIDYVQEDERMGTAGALSLLESSPEDPFFVTNGDILTKVNYANILDAHIEHAGAATVAVREYELQVPFGVIEPAENSGRVDRIVEKPIYRSLINAGIYMLNPDVLEHVPANQYVDMPDLLTTLLKAGSAVETFLVHEYWIDVGHKEHYVAANEEFVEVFT